MMNMCSSELNEQCSPSAHYKRPKHSFGKKVFSFVIKSVSIEQLLFVLGAKNEVSLHLRRSRIIGSEYVSSWIPRIQQNISMFNLYFYPVGNWYTEMFGNSRESA